MNTYNELADDVLADLLHDRDERAFTEIYNRYWGILFSHARRMTKDDELASDAVQDVFAKLWDKAAELKISGALSGYLYGALRNRIINLINSQKVRQDYISDLQQFAEEGVNITDEQVRVRELKRVMEAEIQHLPSKMREIYLLSREAHLSYKQIAETTHLSEETVRKQIYNALKILRAKLGCYFFLGIMKLVLWLCNNFFN